MICSVPTPLLARSAAAGIRVSLLRARVRHACGRRQQQQRPPPPPGCRHRPQLRRRGLRCCAGSSSVDEPPLLSDEDALSSEDQPGSSGGNGGSLRRDEWVVPLPPHLHGKAPRRHWNANALAFLGDSVWEVGF